MNFKKIWQRIWQRITGESDINPVDKYQMLNEQFNEGFKMGISNNNTFMAE